MTAYDLNELLTKVDAKHASFQEQKTSMEERDMHMLLSKLKKHV